MKKSYYSVLLAITSLFATDSDSLDNMFLERLPHPNYPIENIEKTGFTYVRFAAAEDLPFQTDSLIPGLGLGYRRLTKNGAFDISISGIGYAEGSDHRIFWNFPKTAYYHYFTPDEFQSFYAGGGLAWGGVVSYDQVFYGIVPSATLGFEMFRKSNTLAFSELCINQPALAVAHEGKFPGPIIELTLGMGF